MRFTKVLQPSMFIFDEDLQKYVVDISAETIGFGSIYYGVCRLCSHIIMTNLKGGTAWVFSIS